MLKVGTLAPRFSVIYTVVPEDHGSSQSIPSYIQLPLHVYHAFACCSTRVPVPFFCVYSYVVGEWVS